MKTWQKVAVAVAVAAAGGALGALWFILKREITLQADTEYGVTWEKTDEGLLFKNTASVGRRFWIRGADAGENTVVATVKAVSGSLGIEANYSRGEYLRIAEGQVVTFTSEKSDIYDPPNKTIPATPGSPFARVNNADINFWMDVGDSALFIGGQVNKRKISLTNVLEGD